MGTAVAGCPLSVARDGLALSSRLHAKAAGPLAQGQQWRLSPHEPAQHWWHEIGAL